MSLDQVSKLNAKTICPDYVHLYNFLKALQVMYLYKDTLSLLTVAFLICV